MKRGVRLRGTGEWGCDALRAEVMGCDEQVDLVLGGVGTKDTCDGDSGGPLYELTDDGWQLLAVVSRPIRNSRARCGDGGIYTRVDVLGAWLETVVPREESETDSRETGL